MIKNFFNLEGHHNSISISQVISQINQLLTTGVKEKYVGGQGKVLPLIVWYSAEALHLDP